jgi:hypothetical protein
VDGGESRLRNGKLAKGAIKNTKKEKKKIEKREVGMLSGGHGVNAESNWTLYFRRPPLIMYRR